MFPALKIIIVILSAIGEASSAASMPMNAIIAPKR